MIAGEGGILWVKPPRVARVARWVMVGEGGRGREWAGMGGMSWVLGGFWWFLWVLWSRREDIFWVGDIREDDVLWMASGSDFDSFFGEIGGLLEVTYNSLKGGGGGDS